MSKRSLESGTAPVVKEARTGDTANATVDVLQAKKRREQRGAVFATSSLQTPEFAALSNGQRTLQRFNCPPLPVHNHDEMAPFTFAMFLKNAH
jgi:hypothetical protein